MPIIRKRRAPAQTEELSEDEQPASPSPEPEPRRRPHAPTQQQQQQQQEQQQRRRRRRAAESPDSNGSDYASAHRSPTPDGPRTTATTAATTRTTTPAPTAPPPDAIKRLIRLALASEHSRQPLRRQDISAKVLADSGAAPRSFRAVFDAAQLELRDKFGMQLVELPRRELVTVQQRRKAQQAQAAAAQKAGSTGKSSSGGGGGGIGGDGGGSGGGTAARAAQKAMRGEEDASAAGAGSAGPWILTSVLPAKYRTAQIVPPSRAPTAEQEAAYVGLYTFVVSLIYLSQGMLAEPKLERFLRRVNAEQSTPVERTERLLMRMAKDGYIVKIKDSSTGEEVVEYMVGPRGKVEIGEDGVKGMAKAVFGDDDTPVAEDELERRLEKSLRVASTRRVPGASAVGRRDDDDDNDD